MRRRNGEGLEGRNVSGFLLCTLSILPTFQLSAQCPDGSPPPCQRNLAPPRVTIDSNAVAILPFRVSGPAEVQYLKEGMVDLLSIALDGVAGWRVIDPRSVVAGARTITDAGNIPQATQTSRTVGARTTVLGSVVAVGPELRVRAELYDAVLGQRLVTVDARGELARPAPIVDSIAAGLVRERLVLHPGEARRPIEEYASSNPTALRTYLIGEQLARHAALQPAIDTLLRAIALDSTFALSYYRLYTVWRLGGVVRDARFLDVTGTTLRFLDRLPLRQRELLRLVEAIESGVLSDVLSRADDLGRRYPDDAEVAFQEGEAYFHFGLPTGESLERILEPFERAIRLDPGLVDPYIHAIELRYMLGDTTGAWQHVRQLQGLAPDFWITPELDLALRAVLHREDPATLAARLPVVREGLATPVPRLSEDLLGRLVVDVNRMLLDEPASAIALADSFAVLDTGERLPRDRRVIAFTIHAQLSLIRGRYLAAWASLDQAAALDPLSPLVAAYRAVHALMASSHRTEGRSAAAVVAARDTSGWHGAGLLAWGAAIDGDSAAFERAAATVRRIGAREGTLTTAFLAGLEGMMDLSRADTAGARERLTAAVRVRPYATSANTSLLQFDRFTLELARLERAAGAPEAADRHLLSVTRSDSPPALLLAPAEELAAEIALQRGDTAAAIRAYRTFIDLWGEADPELQPRVAAAREALARLKR